ncbi:hypothetical protein Tco_1319932, partial [Tanacetum coccineum]
EVAESAYDVAKEKDRTLQLLEEMEFLAINMKDLLKDGFVEGRYIMSKPTSLDKGKGKNSTRDVPGGRPPNDPDMNLEVHRARQPLAAHHSGISSSEEEIRILKKQNNDLKKRWMIEKVAAEAQRATNQLASLV